MTARPSRSARRVHARGRTAPGDGRQAGSLSLESVLVLPVLALLTLGLIGTVTVLRDVLLVHEAARVGARVAATTLDNGAVEAAVRQAAPELEHLRLQVSPARRGAGDVVTVTAAAGRRLGPTVWQPRARAHARVEPSVDTTMPEGHPWWRPAGGQTRGPVPPFDSGHHRAGPPAPHEPGGVP
ncbi:TadE/TadG family type IV pilus assembly protein [Egicoccus sp. AB-alg2]|uniref:TadE/TadG family type IV pilus assembly protein n=1 Tax=Egicoccus sp. AB-alg2 TaxID=3242693 RepID=UPI00359D86BB